MTPSSRLLDKAREYEQRAVHHAERVDRDELAQDERLEEKITAAVFTGSAIVLREVAECLEDAA